MRSLNSANGFQETTFKMLNSKRRINYLDAIKGFAMVMVVYGHVIIFVLGIKIQSSVIGEFITTFHVPLFFFVSGLLAYKPLKEWNGKNTIKRLKDKFLLIMLPTLIFMTIYHFITNGDLNTLLHNGPKGYWFTYTLFLFFATYYLIAYLCSRINFNYAEIISFVFGIFFILALAAFRPKPNTVQYWLQLENYCNWFQFFAFALLCRRYEDDFKRFIKKDLLRSIIIAVFFISFITHRLYSGLIFDKILVFFVLRYCGVLMFYMFFFKNSIYFDRDTRIGKSLCFIGRRTLDIYLLHYFFLCDLSMLKPFFENNAHPIIEFAFCLAMSLLIVIATLMISHLLRTSDFLAHLLFGSKTKQ